MPCLKALPREWFLPVSVLGPVDFCALRRFASSFFVEIEIPSGFSFMPPFVLHLKTVYQFRFCFARNGRGALGRNQSDGRDLACRRRFSFQCLHYLPFSFGRSTKR